MIDQALSLEEAAARVYLSQPIVRILDTIGGLDACVRPGGQGVAGGGGRPVPGPDVCADADRTRGLDPPPRRAAAPGAQPVRHLAGILATNREPIRRALGAYLETLKLNAMREKLGGDLEPKFEAGAGFTVRLRER